LGGESGCGKTTAGRTILRLLEPSDGEILFHSSQRFKGTAPSSPLNVTHASADVLKQLRREMQIIYQDPYSSLNARMTVGALIEEPLLVNQINDRPARTERVRNLLKAVGLDTEHAMRYPHQFSGGQRQRIAIARALALSPRLIVADEPVSALDVSVQAQVLTLLIDLQQQFNLTYLFITHDLSVVKFHPRCLYAENRCRRETPALRELSVGHQVRCHRAEELSLQGLPIITKEKHEHPRT
jgi:peptide/nickel transport system ATP-binding protein